MAGRRPAMTRAPGFVSYYIRCVSYYIRQQHLPRRFAGLFAPALWAHAGSEAPPAILCIIGFRCIG
jgi:hypothetical protein